MTYTDDMDRQPGMTGGLESVDSVPQPPAMAEVDDSGNPTAASPELTGGEFAEAAALGSGFDTSASGQAATSPSARPAPGSEGASLPGGSDGSDAGGQPSGGAGAGMIAQLQSMIDNVATQAAPVLREVAAKAAELAAVAGQKAGPIAHRAAEATQSVGERVAARGNQVAADLRSRAEGGSVTDDVPMPEGVTPATGAGDPSGSERPGAAPQDPGI